MVVRTREFRMSVSFVGRVIGTKMRKTAKVEVFRLQLDPIVLKVWQALHLQLRIFLVSIISGVKRNVFVL